MSLRLSSPSQIGTSVDEQAVIAIADRFPNPPDYSEATLAELQDSWAQITQTLSSEGHESLDRLILHFTLTADDVGEDVADRCVELLWTIKDSLALMPGQLPKEQPPAG